MKKAKKRRTENDKERNGKSRKFSQPRTNVWFSRYKKRPPASNAWFFINGCDPQGAGERLKGARRSDRASITCPRNRVKIHRQLTCLRVFF